MSEEKMRAEFEEWALREYYLSEYALRRGADGEYKDGRAVLAWATWKASRAALVVELPKSHPRHRDSCIDVMDAELVVEAIEDAGVRVKP